VIIKSQKDFFSGLMFMVVGMAFAVGAYNYGMGDGAKMGPGYFPRMLGVLLGLLGAFIMFKALTVATSDGEKLGKWAWGPMIFILGANLAFGASIGGLKFKGEVVLPVLGMLIGIFALVAIASLADEKTRLKNVLTGVFIGVPLTAIVLAIPKLYGQIPNAFGDSFFRILALPLIALFFFAFWRFFIRLVAPSYSISTAQLFVIGIFVLIKSAFIVFKYEASTVQFVSDLILKVILGVLLVSYMPRVIKQKSNIESSSISLGVLTALLSAISTWAFIDGLKLQIPLWPSIVADALRGIY
jgi:hypothetical protein